MADPRRIVAEWEELFHGAGGVHHCCVASGGLRACRSPCAPPSRRPTNPSGDLFIPGGARLVRAGVTFIDATDPDRGGAELRDWLGEVAGTLPRPSRGSVRLAIETRDGVRLGRWEARVAVGVSAGRP